MLGARRAPRVDRNQARASYHPAMDARVVIAYLVGYVFLDWVSYVHPVFPLGITPWNPPPALSLFLLLRFGLHYWPWLFVAAFAADALVRGLPAPWPVHVEAAILLTAAYALAARLLRQRMPAGLALGSPAALGELLLVVVPVTAVVAVAYVLLFATIGRVPAESLGSSIVRHWVGDLIGILVFAPVLLAVPWRRFTAWRPSARTALEVAAQATSLALALWIVFGLPQTDEFKFFYLLFLPVLWIAVRWGLVGAALGLAGTQLGLIVAIQLGGYHAATFVQLQILTLSLAVTALMLGAVVSQREQVERELRRKQDALSRSLQFAAAGEMSSALTHELNQPMTALSNYLRASQLMLRDPAHDRDLLDRTMGKAVDEARRAGAVMQRLRDFFRRGDIALEPVAVATLVGDAVEAARPRAEQAQVALRVGPVEAGRPVVADRVQISLVLHNLLVNAIDSIVAAGAARREVAVAAEDGAEAVRIVVEDTGAGIAPEVAATMFDPFITTKAHGMGLGLAISRTLVRAHGGDLAHEPRDGGGARFVLTLPRNAPEGEGR